jgi:hypothetical protein
LYIVSFRLTMELFWELDKGMYAFSLTKPKLDSTLCLLTCCVVFDVCELKVFVFFVTLHGVVSAPCVCH